MIRKPEAKTQAELIITEIAGHGFDLKRGHALDLVAKLQGFRGWNEFLAAEKVTQEPAPARAQASGMQYYVPGISGLVGYCEKLSPSPSGQPEVSDGYLAAYLRHSRGEVTDLLSHKVDGHEYYLRICGQIRAVVQLPGKPAVEVRSSDGITPAYIRAIEALRASPEVEWDNAPFFEWINENGDPVGDVFDTISVDPQDEINSLLKMMKNDK